MRGVALTLALATFALNTALLPAQTPRPAQSPQQQAQPWKQIPIPPLPAFHPQQPRRHLIGRYVNREWSCNDRQLRGLAHPFDWTRCAHCDGTERTVRTGGARI